MRIPRARGPGKRFSNLVDDRGLLPPSNNLSCLDCAGQNDLAAASRPLFLTSLRFKFQKFAKITLAPDVPRDTFAGRPA